MKWIGQKTVTYESPIITLLAVAAVMITLRRLPMSPGIPWRLWTPQVSWILKYLLMAGCIMCKYIGMHWANM